MTAARGILSKRAVRLSALLASLLIVGMGPARAGSRSDAAGPSPARDVSGEVLDVTGAALPGALVEVHDPEGRRLASVVTDEGGRFRIQGPAGGYSVRVSYTGFEDVTRRIRVNGREPLVFRLRPAGFSEEVRITATRADVPASALPNTVTVLDRSDLDVQTAIRDDLASVLENSVPGFGPSLGKLSGRAESLRGRNPLYTINGVPQHNPLRDGQRDGHTIELDFVERVEVVHGSNALQGIGATGGVVNLVTKSPRSDGRWTQDLRLSVSTNDDFDSRGFAPKVSYLLGKRFDRFELTGGFSVHQRDLFFDAHDEPIGLYPTQGDLMDSTSRNLYFKGGVDLDPEQRIELTFNDFRLARDGDYVVVAGDREAGIPTSTAPGDPGPVVGNPAVNDVSTLSAEYRHDALFGGEAVVRFFYQDFRALFEGGTFGDFFRLTLDGPPFLDQSEIDSRKVGMQSSYSPRSDRLAGLGLTFGLDVGSDATVQRLARSDREWVPETTLFNVAPFLQLRRNAGRFSFSGGLRVENAGLEVDDYTTIASAGATFVRGGSPDYAQLLPNAGVVFTAHPGLSLYGSYSEGFTMPDVGRVLRAVGKPGTAVEDFIDLDPVVTDNVELGVDLRRGSSAFHLAYYRSTSVLGSRLDADPNGIFRVRREATQIEGLDVTGVYEITSAFSVGGSYAWLRGRFDSTGDGTPDSDLDGNNIAPNRLNLHVDGEVTSWLTARLQTSTLFDRRFEGPAAPEGRDFEGFTIADLLAVVDPGVGIFRIGVENLLDKQYVTYFAQTEPFARADTFFAGRGRTLTIQYERRF